MNIYVQVYDNDGAFSVYDISNSITVSPDLTNLEIIMDKLISNDPYFSANIILNQGSYLDSIQIIQVISSILNEQSYSEKSSMIANKSSIAFPKIFGPMENYTGVNLVINHVLFIKKNLMFLLNWTDCFY